MHKQHQSGRRRYLLMVALGIIVLACMGLSLAITATGTARFVVAIGQTAEVGYAVGVIFDVAKALLPVALLMLFARRAFFGRTYPFRISLAIWAIVWGIAACVFIRYVGLLVDHGPGKVMSTNEVLSELKLAVLISTTAPIYALMGYFEAWANPWAIENCGDRLWQLIYGPRAVSAAPKRSKKNAPNFDGMAAHEVFGIGLSFTRGELDGARRRLVQELHPDRWHNAKPQERKAREEALKRVNAAYDLLRQQTS